MADKSKNMMPIASKALGIKHNKLRVGIKKDVLNAKYHGRSIAGSDFSQSNDNPPDNSLICLLLVGNDIELRNYVLENWKYLDAIVGNHLDICLVGYRGKSFIGKEFMKTVHQLSMAEYTNPEHPEIIYNIPPCYLVTSKADMLERYTLDFAGELGNKGVEHYLRYMGSDPKLIHAFPVLRPDLSESERVIDEIVGWFREHET